MNQSWSLPGASGRTHACKIFNYFGIALGKSTFRDKGLFINSIPSLRRMSTIF